MNLAVLGHSPEALPEDHHNNHANQRDPDGESDYQPHWGDETTSGNPIVDIVRHSKLVGAFISFGGIHFRVEKLLTPKVFFTTVEVTMIWPLTGL